MLEWLEAKLTTGRNRACIEREAALQWHVTERTIRRYIAKIHKQWADEATANRPAVRDHLRQSMWTLYVVALDKGDLRTCARLLEQLAKLDGANEADQVKVDLGAAVAVVEPDPDKARARLAELLARPEVADALKAGK